MAKLNKLVESKEAALIDQDNKINELYKEIDRLTKASTLASSTAIKRTGEELKPQQVVEMLAGKVDIGLNRKKVDFDYELQNVDAFLELDHQGRTEYFFTKYLAWYVAFKVVKELEVQYLAVYLYSANYTVSSVMQPIKTTYDLTLLTQTGIKNKSFSSTNEFGTPSTSFWGLAKFISINDLKLGGYIKNNKFKVRVHLEVHDPVLAGY